MLLPLWWPASSIAMRRPSMKRAPVVLPLRYPRQRNRVLQALVRDGHVNVDEVWGGRRLMEV